MNFIDRMQIIRAVARFCPKWLRSPVYRMLHSTYSPQYTLSESEFDGKRILILGPAVTAKEDILALEAQRFDVIVKMNNGVFVPVTALQERNRCDILFHSLSLDTIPVTTEQIKSCGVKTIVHRAPTRSAFLKTILAEGRFEGIAPVKIIASINYKSLSRRLNGFSPSTGLTCVDFFLRSQAAEVAVIGFTFFSTRYTPEYNGSVATDIAAQDRIKIAGHHSPKYEARLMKELIAQARDRGTIVTIGAATEKAMYEVGK